MFNFINQKYFVLILIKMLPNLNKQVTYEPIHVKKTTDYIDENSLMLNIGKKNFDIINKIYIKNQKQRTSINKIGRFIKN